jgi:FkbM family methyltransferase
MTNFFLELPSYLNRKIKTKKTSFSLTGIDLIIDYIFKKKNGFYIDVGCNHPVYNNNTFLLHKKGWGGINIDIDTKSIELFNIFRAKDLNLNVAASSKKTVLDYLYFHDKSPINKIKSKENNNEQSFQKIKKINSDTLDSIIENSVYKNKEIDFLSIDVEGHELEVIKGFNLQKYKPRIIVIEYLDKSLKKIEIKNFNLQNILNSKIHQIMINNGYNIVNWLHSDLIYAHNSFKD